MATARILLQRDFDDLKAIDNEYASKPELIDRDLFRWRVQIRGTVGTSWEVRPRSPLCKENETILSAPQLPELTRSVPPPLPDLGRRCWRRSATGRAAPDGGCAHPHTPLSSP